MDQFQGLGGNLGSFVAEILTLTTASKSRVYCNSTTCLSQVEIGWISMGEVKRWLNLFYCKMEWNFLLFIYFDTNERLHCEEEEKTMAKAHPHMLTLTQHPN